MSKRLCLFLILSIGVLFMGEQGLSISPDSQSASNTMPNPITVSRSTVGHKVSPTTVLAHNQSQSLRRRGTGRREILAVPTFPESLATINWGQGMMG